MKALGKFDYPLWKEVPTFWGALGYMIAKGVDELYVRILVSEDQFSTNCGTRIVWRTYLITVVSTWCPSILILSSCTDDDVPVVPCTVQAIPAGQFTPSSSVIHTHVRNLHGVMESRYYPSVVASGTTVSGFNTLSLRAQKYLLAHGYVEAALAVVVEAQRSSQTSQQFARALACHGLPLAEGLFLWDMLNT